MDADTGMTERAATPEVEADAPAEAPTVPPAWAVHNIMDVLRPATPPEPRNARIIRRFDLEAAKHDPQPGQPAPVNGAPQQQSRSREEARALRNRSLAAAARLV